MSHLPPAPPPPPPQETEEIPPFLLPTAPRLHTPPSNLFKQRSWSPDMSREEAWARRKGSHRSRQRRSKSVTDEDLDELKACIELGFGFDSPEVDPKLSDTLPALGFYYAVVNNKQFNDISSSRSSNSTETSDGGSSPISPADSPRHPTIFSPGDRDNPNVVKTRLRQWAQVVACSVRHSSG